MSRAYKCDCCGKLFESYLEEGKIKQIIVVENISKLNSKDEKISYDVCKECFTKIEKILNQMINVVNAIVEEYGKPDEVRIELARELKKSAKEREEMTKLITKTTDDHEKYKAILQKEECSHRRPLNSCQLYLRL